MVAYVYTWNVTQYVNHQATKTIIHTCNLNTFLSEMCLLWAMLFELSWTLKKLSWTSNTSVYATYCHNLYRETYSLRFTHINIYAHIFCFCTPFVLGLPCQLQGKNNLLMNPNPGEDPTRIICWIPRWHP